MKYLKVYEEFEYMWDNPDYYKNFLKVGDYIVLSNDDVKNEVAIIVKFCNREDYPEYNTACEFINPENLKIGGNVVGGDGLYYVCHDDIVRKLEDHKVAALKYNL
jgi:hypothetical protein